MSALDRTMLVGAYLPVIAFVIAFAAVLHTALIPDELRRRLQVTTR